MTKQVLESLQAGLSADLLAFLPELILCAAIVFMLLVRLVPRFDRRHLGWVALVLTVYALMVALNQWLGKAYDPRPGPENNRAPLELFSGLLVFDYFSIFVKL